MRVIYEVGVGSGCANGEVFVDDNATSDDILLEIMSDLYYVKYEIVDEDKE